MRFPLALALMLCVPGAVGCGTSQVFTDDPGARIWANGQMIGKGHGEIQQYGMPETTTIMVRAEDGRQESTTVKRKITGVTVLGAFLTYGTCLIFCWSYPDTIWASLPTRAASAFGAPGGAADPWLLPPPGWQPKATATPQATPPAETPAGKDKIAPPNDASDKSTPPTGKSATPAPTAPPTPRRL